MFDTGYLHKGLADKDSYPHDGCADKDSYPPIVMPMRILNRTSSIVNAFGKVHKYGCVCLPQWIELPEWTFICGFEQVKYF